MIKLTDIIPQPVKVDLGDISQPIYVRRLAVGDLGGLSDLPADRVGSMCSMLEVFMCDEAGNPLVETDEDRAALPRIPAEMATKIIATGMEVNGLRDEKSAAEAEENAGK